MPNDGDWQIMHLARVLDGVLTPLLEGLRQRPHGPDQMMQVATLLEFFAWLQLGALVGYFPKVEVVRITREVLPLYVQEGSLDSDELRFVLDAGIAELLRSGIRGKNVVEEEPFVNFRDPEAFYSAYQMSLNLSVKFWQVRAAHLLSGAAAFGVERTWEGYMHGNDLSEALEYLEPSASPAKANRAVLCAGSLQALDHMATYQAFFDQSLAVLRRQTGWQFAIFQRRVGQIQQWRFNFHQTLTDERFQQCVGIVADEYFGQGAGLFRQTAGRIMLVWRDRGEAAAQVAGA